MLRLLTLLLCLTLVACGREEAAEPPGPTPRELLFGVSLPGHLRLSPGGRWVSFSQAYDGVRNLWLKPARGEAAARPLTTFPYPGVGAHVWHPSGEYLLFLRQTPQADDVRPYVYDLREQEVRSLFGDLGQQASFLSFSNAQPDSVYIQTNARQAGQLDIYQVDLKTGASLLVHQDTLGANGYFAGPDLSPLIAQVPRDDGGFDWRIRTIDGGWRLWGQVEPGDALTTRIEGISADGQSVYVASSAWRDTSAFARLDTAARFDRAGLEVLAAQEDYDFADASYNPLTQTPFVAMFSTPRPSFVPLDNRLVPLIFGMRASDSGSLIVVDASAEADRWLIGHVTASQPVKWGVFDEAESSKIALFPEQDDLLSQQAAILPAVVQIPAGETRSIDGFLSLPLGLERDAQSRTEKTVPVAIVLRGAIASRDQWAYSPIHQWLASRGVAVLSINHRGSVGQGKSHLYPDEGLSQALEADVRLAIDWLKQQGILGDQLAVIGGGASTSAALSMVQSNPSAAQCLALTHPVFSMDRALSTLPAHQGGLAKLLKASFGGAQAQAYPAVPTFIAAAGEYRRERAEDVFAWSARAMKAGTPLTLMAAVRSDTRFDQGADGRAVMATMELFLSSCLGFDAEPLTYSDFKGATVELVEAPADFAREVREAQTPPELDG